MSEDPRTDTVDGVLRRSAARRPEHTALTFDDRSWTYRELDDAVTRAAGRLLALGLAPGDRVAGYGVNSDAYVIGFLACSRAGLVHVPVNYALTGDELRYLLAQSGSRAVLVDPALRSSLESVRADLGVEHVVTLRGEGDSLLEWTRDGDVPQVPARVSGGDLAQLLYTSGTTSKPKGAMMTHGALVHEYVSSVIALGLNADDNPLICMPLYHSAGMHVFMLPYLVGGGDRAPDADAGHPRDPAPHRGRSDRPRCSSRRPCGYRSRRTRTSSGVISRRCGRRSTARRSCL